ncbi:MAG: OsmC family protein [Burkholderiales bacterium]|nr:OsmC family protein [Burkholderiales bacterium]
MSQSTARAYTVNARSTETFGRVLCSSRNHHFIVDGPVQNGCPGEAVTPAELFLAAVAACGVELLQAIAKEMQAGLRAIAVEISGLLDRANPVRTDVTVFNAVKLRFQLAGVTPAQGAELIDRFKGR